MRVGSSYYRVYAQCVSPHGVLPYVWFGIRVEGFVAERQHLTLLAVDIVSVGILKRIHPVSSRRNASYHETSTAVGSRHPYERFSCKHRVGEVVVESHEYSLYGLKVCCVEHISRHLEGVNSLTRGKTVCVVSHRVALVVVGYGVGKVYGVGCVVHQRVLQFHHNFLSRCFYVGRFYLWRRDDNLACRVLQFYKLVKCYGHLLRLHSRSLVSRVGMHDPWRSVVIPAPVGLSHSCTRDNHCQQQANQYPSIVVLHRSKKHS